MKKILDQTWTFHLSLLILSFLCYGLLAPWLGFYWDDWAMVWHAHAFGPTGFIDYWSMDRPFLAWIFIFTSFLLGETPWHWQLFAILTHWIAAVALWWMLKSLWQEHIQQVNWIAFAFTVYPGFMQQYISYTYSHYFVILALFFTSLSLMIRAIRTPKCFISLTIAALILSALNMFSMEYFFSLDLTRPLIIWFLLDNQIPGFYARCKKTFFLWLPYLLLLVLFLIWRVFIFKFPTYQPFLFNEIKLDPVNGILGFIQTILLDVTKSLLSAWAQVFHFPDVISFGLKSTLLYASIVIISTLGVFIFLKLKTPHKSGELNQGFDKVWTTQSILLGIFALLAGGWPFWIPNLTLEFVFPWDRFSLPMIFGASILLISIINMIFHSPAPKVIVIAILIGLAIGFQFQIATTYRRDWNSQKNFLWQMTWRIPSLKPGTLILSNDLPFDYSSDHSLTGALNWVYDPDNHSKQMSYMINYVNVRLGSVLPGFKENLPIKETYRAATFNSSTSQALTIYYAPPACLRVLDPEIDHLYPLDSENLTQAVNISHLDQIITSPEQPAQPPALVVGSEPAHSWCYYFEKADLARQTKDWQQIVKLGEEAFKLDDKPNEATELLPFIEGYAHSGEWDKAVNLSYDMVKMNPYRQPMLCALWDKVEKSSSLVQEKKDHILKLKDSLKCSSE
jgi:hypothetical protein